MKQFTQRELIKICIANGFHFERISGDHAVYINKEGRHISIPNHLRCVIANRLIKENNLETDLKKLKRERKMDNYPTMSQIEENNAPWNDSKEPKEVEVIVSMTISKVVKVQVSDYEVLNSKDEYGQNEVDFDNCDLKTAVEEQITLPTDVCEGWYIDEFEALIS